MSATPQPATWNSATFCGDACSRLAHRACDLGLIFGPLHERRQRHIERVREQDDLLERRARTAALDAADVGWVDIGGERDRFDRSVLGPAHATDRTPQVPACRRHDSDRDQAKRVQVQHAPRRADTFPLGLDHVVGCELEQCAIETRPEVSSQIGPCPPARMIVTKQLQHDSALHTRKNTTLGLHRKVPPFGATPPACSNRCGGNSMRCPDARLPRRCDQPVSLHVSPLPPRSCARATAAAR
jgi:hypothetical protein